MKRVKPHSGRSSSSTRQGGDAHSGKIPTHSTRHGMFLYISPLSKAANTEPSQRNYHITPSQTKLGDKIRDKRIRFLVQNIHTSTSHVLLPRRRHANVSLLQSRYWVSSCNLSRHEYNSHRGSKNFPVVSNM